MEGSISLYCTNLRSLLQNAGSAVSEGERFANLEIQETDDEFVYLDARKETCWRRLRAASRTLAKICSSGRAVVAAMQTAEAVLVG